MARKRSIEKSPSDHKNYFVVDANFLAYVALPKRTVRSKLQIRDSHEKERADRCFKWWEKIKRQLRDNVARVYVPDICIAEAFKVLAKWYYQRGWFATAEAYSQARKRLRKFVSTTHTEMAKADRLVQVHDVPTDRDIVIAVDRFFETMFSRRKPLNVEIPDLMLLAVAKYLMDFYDIPKSYLYIITLDKTLAKLTKKIPELPAPIDPTEDRYDVESTFV